MAKIMIVDDSSFMRSSLKYIVEKGGNTVVGMAAKGDEAIDLYKKFNPDLVTMDILMPGMDGLATAHQIMKINKKAKIVMVTAIGQTEKQDEARKIGVSGYIRKPFKEQEINDEIKRIMAI
jgi:two-component system, chemotaxis family, chemotaxis protein CheY